MIGNKRIGLDVDGVLRNFNKAWIEGGHKLGFGKSIPSDWNHQDSWNLADPNIQEIMWNELCPHRDFWINMEPFQKGLPFFPELYLTASPFSFTGEVTFDWLNFHGFPLAPVKVVAFPIEKLEVLREFNIDVYVEDKSKSFKLFNESGVETLLLDRPWNQDVDAGNLRIYSLNEIPARYLSA